MVGRFAYRSCSLGRDDSYTSRGPVRAAGRIASVCNDDLSLQSVDEL